MEIQCMTVGAFSVNTYLVQDKATGQAAVIDTGETIEQTEYLLSLQPSVDIRMILLTHGHLDQCQKTCARLRRLTKI